MKSKAKILSCICSMALCLPTGLKSLAMPPKKTKTTSTPGFALGLQVGSITRACYNQLAASPCNEADIIRITEHFIGVLSQKLGDLYFVAEKSSPTISMLRNRISRIQAIQKRLLDMLHGEWINTAGIKTRKTQAQIKAYCKNQSKIPTRNKKEDLTLGGFIVYSDEESSTSDSEYSSSDESSASGSESSSSDESSTSGSESSSSDESSTSGSESSGSDENSASGSDESSTSESEPSSSDENSTSSPEEVEMVAKKRPRNATVVKKVKKTTVEILKPEEESLDDEEFEIVRRKKHNPIVLDKSDSSDDTKEDKPHVKGKLYHDESSSDDESDDSEEPTEQTTFFSFSYTETTTVCKLTPAESKKSPKKKNVKDKKSSSSSPAEAELGRKDDKPKHRAKYKNRFLVDSDSSSDSDHTPKATKKPKKD